VLLEAGLNGLCPVAYDIAGTRDLVPTGTGHLLPLGNVDGMEQALRALRDDRTELMRLATAFQNHVWLEFGMDAYRQRMDALLADMR
jgi:glycosyltransferase involved in cell wall biosynthesis